CPPRRWPCWPWPPRGSSSASAGATWRPCPGRPGRASADLPPPKAGPGRSPASRTEAGGPPGPPRRTRRPGHRTPLGTADGPSGARRAGGACGASGTAGARATPISISTTPESPVPARRRRPPPVGTMRAAAVLTTSGRSHRVPGGYGVSGDRDVQPVRQRLGVVRPRGGRCSRLPRGDHTAHDGARGVDVAADLRGRPERPLVVAQGTGGRPEREGHRVVGRRAPAAAEDGGDGG